jgi:predicted ester cyclase
MSTEMDERSLGLDVGFLDEWSRRWLAAWDSREVEAIVSMCDEDLRLDDPALPEALHGRAGIRAFAVDTFETFPDLRLEALEPPCPSRSGSGAWSPYRMSGTMNGRWRPLGLAPTGAGVDFRGVTEWHFRDELLVLWDTTYDNLEVARQMGLIPRQGGRADRIFSKLQPLQAWAQRRANA